MATSAAEAMATLGVEVAGAGVELRFDGHRFRMVVKLKELDPVWKQPLYSDPRQPICSKLCPLTLEASVYGVNESAQGSSSNSVELDLASMSSFIQRLSPLCDFVLEACFNESAPGYSIVCLEVKYLNMTCVIVQLKYLNQVWNQRVYLDLLDLSNLRVVILVGGAARSAGLHSASVLRISGYAEAFKLLMQYKWGTRSGFIDRGDTRAQIASLYSPPIWLCVSWSYGKKKPMWLCVEVVSAYDLTPMDEQGSASTFVELAFDNFRYRTAVKEKDLNPVWNERFYFDLSDPTNLPQLHHKALSREQQSSFSGYIYENALLLVTNADESSGLDWSTRYTIIKGISNGLCYLHDQIDKPIIHLDLKPANILLDDNMVPKVTDFGLSRLLDQQTICTSSRDGTFGYMAPEFLNGGKITPKSNMFSLGVIIMEVVTRHRDYPVVVTKASSDHFIELTLTKWRNVLQRSLGHRSLETDLEQIKRCMHVGLICVNPDHTKRPQITEVISMLEEVESTMFIPK